MANKTIKQELKEKYLKALENKEELEQKLTNQARDLIESFIIPCFREISEKYPLKSTLSVNFFYNVGHCLITTSFDEYTAMKNPYDSEVVEKAADLAKEYDIYSCKDSGTSGKMIIFILDLTN